MKTSLFMKIPLSVTKCIKPETDTILMFEFAVQHCIDSMMWYPWKKNPQK